MGPCRGKQSKPEPAAPLAAGNGRLTHAWLRQRWSPSLSLPSPPSPGHPRLQPPVKHFLFPLPPPQAHPHRAGRKQPYERACKQGLRVLTDLAWPCKPQLQAVEGSGQEARQGPWS